MIALATSDFFLTIWTSVHPVHASTSIWTNLLPSISLGLIGPVVSEDTASRTAYRFGASLWKGALVALPVAHGGHDRGDWVSFNRSMWRVASGYSWRNHAMILLLAWLSVLCVCSRCIAGAIRGPFFFLAVVHSCVLSNFGTLLCAFST
eukprot:Plantae.Rhodophyta-Palmaria_palmata.ctg6572.p2 GENE.Plantae.Rhodophyta-Palmaria_palmata.ctg6572~~Plantae.Rhodophyta-Palmaria_palmata.ctg6572.p2  ORF type:complete len:149 (+),score=1.26 Plantae.Rhodophyta-Palmaria_palmata.ctg6572:280-726(+)